MPLAEIGSLLPREEGFHITLGAYSARLQPLTGGSWGWYLRRVESPLQWSTLGVGEEESRGAAWGHLERALGDLGPEDEDAQAMLRALAALAS